jgi:hypothetical protein
MIAYSPQNYQAMRARIKRAETPADIARIERAMDRLWDAGAFRAGEAMRLHAEIMRRDCEIASR